MSEQTLPYDKKSKDSILEHAQRMLGKTLWEMYGEARLLDTGKGSLGNAVEKYHFQYEPNSKSEPDFKEAGVELKCTPLKKASDGSMLSKERLVLNVIDYIEEATKTFDTSSFWKKNALLLLMFYLHEEGKLPYDLIFKIVRYWNFPETDLKIIRDEKLTKFQKAIRFILLHVQRGRRLVRKCDASLNPINLLPSVHIR